MVITRNVANKMTHPHPNRRFVPQAVLTKSGKINTVGASVNTAGASVNTVVRPFNTAGSKPTGNPQQKEYKEKGIIDSGCSRHMTGNKCYLTEYEDYNGGYVSFGDGKGRISGKGKIKTGTLDFDNVYFCKELKYNLFSMSQICDKKNNVLFTDTKCLVLSSDFKLLDESQVLLRVPRKDNIYSVDLKSVVPTKGLTYLFAKATIDEFNLWHTRLGHINFKNMNKLVRGNLVRGLPSKIFENDHSVLLGIKREFSIARTPQQNGVAKRRNRTLIEAARTMESLGKFDDGKLMRDGFVRNTTQWYCRNREYIVTGLKLRRKTDLEQRIHPNTFLPMIIISHGLRIVKKIWTEGYSRGSEENKSQRLSELLICLFSLSNRTQESDSSSGRSKLDRNNARGASAISTLEVRNKVRLVAQGYTQEERINYDKVFAPVARIEAIRLFLAYALFMGFIVYQMDVKSAFLYEKALYGLHQAPKAWYETLSTYLIENGFRRGTIDKTLFIKKDKGDILLEQVYVDDIIFELTKKSLCDKFEVKTAGTPLETNKALIKDEEAESVDVYLYRSMIRSLMYLIASRPNIMFAICACARFQVTPNTSHLHTVKRIFRYLKGQPKLGLWYPRDSPFDLEAFSDSDYAGASLDRKSTTGGCQFLGKRLISWQCKKQTIVANSTTKAEYVAAANCYG
ncbi:putative ribonuclease H-like domain-containing protein [Tanacetum coccineum]|uniref:Ribonuclease H-like domain-containing protein n=1 Tax=Tanacetum coccineum TaxID=301880 RepID=A0ABQ5ABL0_9ASTR